MIALRCLPIVFAMSLMSVGTAHAAPVAPETGGTIIALTPQQVEAAKEAAAERNMEAQSGLGAEGISDRAIHGEMGFAIGTGGYRSVFGSAALPLGNDGVFAFSFENTQADPVRYGYRRR